MFDYRITNDGLAIIAWADNLYVRTLADVINWAACNAPTNRGHCWNLPSAKPSPEYLDRRLDQ